LEVYKAASLELEATKVPTLQLPLPWHKRLIKHCIVDEKDSNEISILKGKATQLTDEKFVLKPLHHIATALNPKMKGLNMLPEGDKQKIYQALRLMVSQIAPSDCPSVNASEGKMTHLCLQCRSCGRHAMCKLS